MEGLVSRILAHFKRDYREPAKTFLRTGRPAEKRIPEYIMRAFEDDPEGYLTPYQLALYYPLADEETEKALKETMAEVEGLVRVGWLKVSKVWYLVRKVMIPGWIYESLEQEIRISEGEKKERLGLLHGCIRSDKASVEDLTDTAVLEEKGFFKSRDSRVISLAVKPYQIIYKNLNKWLNLGKTEIIGTYHTHLVPYCHPSFKDMTILMANPGKPHLILCGQGLFAYAYNFKKALCLEFPIRVFPEIMTLANIESLGIEKV